MTHAPPERGRRLRDRWRAAMGERRLRTLGLAALLLLPVALALFGRFVQWVEDRAGVVLDDPVLAWLSPVDLSVPTFVLIYAGLLLALVSLALTPRRLIAAVHGYMILLGFRALMMWAAPLDPPPGIVELRDPLVELSGDGGALTRDLFFSGHVATLFLLSLAVAGRGPRRVLLALAALVGVATLWQHVHYAVDVLVAPFVAFGAYALASRLVGHGDGSASRPQRGA